MSNTTIGLLIGSGVATGAALVYAVRAHRRHRSFLARTVEHVGFIKQGLKTCGSAVAFIEKGREELERQKKGLAEALHAGVSAYQRVAG
jgi:hypothetical protein